MGMLSCHMLMEGMKEALMVKVAEGTVLAALLCQIGCVENALLFISIRFPSQPGTFIDC